MSLKRSIKREIIAGDATAKNSQVERKISPRNGLSLRAHSTGGTYVDLLSMQRA